MEIPEYLMGDNTDNPEDVFVIHTQFPRFIINLKNDEVEWLEEFSKEDEKELAEQTENFIHEASTFYDREVERYKN